MRRAITGTIRETPSSVHFSIAHSMRSNLKIARTRVISASSARGNLFAQLELDAVVAYGCDSSAAHGFAGGDVELLSDASAEHAHQMIRMLADQSGSIT